MPVVEVGLGPDDLRVEELEPRLEFMGDGYGGWCEPAYIPAGGSCTSCMVGILVDLYEERSCSDWSLIV